jgi:arsenite-transporting ATPase
VLIVSTDPASNLDDVFGITAGPQLAAVPGVAGSAVSTIDPEAAAKAFMERAVAPYRGVLPDVAIVNMEEQLSGACTVEIAAFNEFTGLLADPALTEAFDHVIFDTAPTGHTLRLLTLPSAWSGYATEHPAGASCLGPLAGLDQQREQYARAVEQLSDPAVTTLVLVTRPEAGALREAARASRELAELGVGNQHLVVNGVLAYPGEDPTAMAFADRQSQAMAGEPEILRVLLASAVGLVAGTLTGIPALRSLTADDPDSAEAEDLAPVELPGVAGLVAELDRAGSGVVMTMGKGGVGKTTLAAALAIALVDHGHQVTLSTTDPAAHVADALAGSALDELVIERIDPAVETERYTQEVLAAAQGLDDEGRTLLEEDLRSPCTEEIAVFRAFARTIATARDRIVLLDTAPTGHTLLLLDAAQSYHREVQRTTADVPDDVTQLLARLRDPEFARVLVVTLAESTSVHEADRLQSDLQRAGIEPYAWVINASLAGSATTHPVLRGRAAGEPHQIERAQRLASRSPFLVGWQPEPPIGVAALRDLVGDLAAASS